MKIECDKCGEIVETTATTVVAPFVCDQCDQCDLPSDPGIRAQAESRQIKHDACDTATVENTTLLIEDLQQQLADERATIIALEDEKSKQQKTIELLTTRESALNTQVKNQADLIKQQEQDIDQDLSAIVQFLREKNRLEKQIGLLDQSNLRLLKSLSIVLGQLDYEWNEAKRYFSYYKDACVKWNESTRHPIRQYFKNLMITWGA